MTVLCFDCIADTFQDTLHQVSFSYRCPKIKADSILSNTEGKSKGSEKHEIPIKWFLLHTLGLTNQIDCLILIKDFI